MTNQKLGATVILVAIKVDHMLKKSQQLLSYDLFLGLFELFPFILRTNQMVMWSLLYRTLPRIKLFLKEKNRLYSFLLCGSGRSSTPSEIKPSLITPCMLVKELPAFRMEK